MNRETELKIHEFVSKIETLAKLNYRVTEEILGIASQFNHITSDLHGVDHKTHVEISILWDRVNTAMTRLNFDWDVTARFIAGDAGRCVSRNS